MKNARELGVADTVVLGSKSHLRRKAKASPELFQVRAFSEPTDGPTIDSLLARTVSLLCQRLRAYSSEWSVSRAAQGWRGELTLHFEHRRDLVVDTDADPGNQSIHCAQLSLLRAILCFEADNDQ